LEVDFQNNDFVAQALLGSCSDATLSCNFTINKLFKTSMKSDIQENEIIEMSILNQCCTNGWYNSRYLASKVLYLFFNVSSADKTIQYYFDGCGSSSFVSDSTIWTQCSKNWLSTGTFKNCDCSLNGNSYAGGSSFANDCNKCTCAINGLATCTELTCGNSIFGTTLGTVLFSVIVVITITIVAGVICFFALRKKKKYTQFESDKQFIDNLENDNDEILMDGYPSKDT